jgi:hypothetical protein
MPSLSGVMQVMMLISPSTSIMQLEQRPMAQKKPRARFFWGLRRNIFTPAA